MIINSIDEIFDIILNNFFDFLYKKDIFKKYTKDPNFVVYQEEILKLIYEYVKSVDNNDILKIMKNKDYLNNIINIIKRYCAYCIYLGIGYYYKDSRDLFITNIIETSKNQKDTTYVIENFFNSDNNSKIINFYTDIQNIIKLVEFKTMDKIKIIISNNPVKFASVLKLFDELGEDYIIDNFLVKDNFQNIIKTIIFKFIYLKEEKKEINNLLNEVDKINSEYKYIEIIVSNSKKIVDINIIQKFLTLKEIKKGYAEDIYNYLEEYQEEKEIIIKQNEDYINYLFSNKIIIPINEDFIRYHKDSEKYGGETYNKKDDTKIKYIISKMNNIVNYYSPIIYKNPKTKLEVEKYFYKNLDPRMAILYNDNEEIKIIQKLIQSENSNDYDLLIQLQNFRKYAYNNFKNVSKDYIKLRTDKTIESIRYINLKKKKKKLIKKKIFNNNIDLNVVGIAFNPLRFKCENINIDLYTIDDLIDIRKISKNNNGFLSFIKLLNKSFNNNNKLYYWLFNNETDIPKLNKYIDYNKNDSQNNFNIMLAEIYNIWSDIIYKKIINDINKINIFNIFDIDYFINIYGKKYFNFNLNPEIKNLIINKIFDDKIKELEIEEDITDNIIPGQRKKIIKLPILKIEKNKKNIIIIDKNINNNYDENDELNIKAICNHYIKWSNLNKILRNDIEDQNQLVFEFIKKYVKQNDKGEYICKSCNEVLSITKFVKEGTYNKEMDEFMTTSLIVKQKLSELPKYDKLKRTIKNLESIIEKIAYLSDINYYIGNDSIIKLHRKTLIKDTIDLILLHTEYLRKQPKDRIQKASENYNINKDFTNLFFFELKDEIFLTSSTDTDYYKLIKFNNVIAYLILIMITELNSGQILNLKNDKRCNYFFYSKVSEILFKNLYLRIGDKEKILITNFPLLTYCIYYFTCILTNNKIWLYNNSEDKNINITIQKTIINTLVDLLNSIIEANLEKGKNYLYEILAARILDKIKNLFNDKQLIKRIDELINKKILIDKKTNKISFITKKINYIDINNFDSNINNIFNINNKKYCEVITKKNNKVKFKIDNNKIDNLTNCDTGSFHEWIFTNNNLVCKLCNKIYTEILNENNTTESSQQNINYFEKLKVNFIKKLTKKYCLSGDLHQININTNICEICKINPDTFKYTNKELLSLEKILNTKENDNIIQNYKILKNKEKESKENIEKNNKIINNFDDSFNENFINKYSSNKLENYLLDFINRLINILGKKIKIKNKTTYLKDTLYTLDHNYLGNTIKNEINILSSDNLLLTFINHPSFDKDVFYYKDKINKVYVYYDIVTLQYLGYSENNKNVIKNKNNASLKIEYSIKDCLSLLGLENTYTNLYHIDSSLINKDIKLDNNLINIIIRNRIINLKQIISRAQSILNSINNHNKNSNMYNIKEKEIINEFITKLKNFNMNKIFKNSKYICNLINFKPIKDKIDFPLNNYYFNNDILNKLINADTKIIYYIINNFNKLLDNNEESSIQSEIAYLIIRMIQYFIELYIKDNNNSEIRKLDYLILIDQTYIDERMHFNDEFVNDEQDMINEEDKDKLNELKYDAQETNDALDIDDYDQDDDIDGNMEALDGDIDT